MKHIGVSQTVVIRHIDRYFPTLKHFPHEYPEFVNVGEDSIKHTGIYLCPLCLKNHIALVDKNVVSKEILNLDHFPQRMWEVDTKYLFANLAITHITRPIYSLLHLLPKERYILRKGIYKKNYHGQYRKLYKATIS